jgi:tRNA-dihydrouridine synthase B
MNNFSYMLAPIEDMTSDAFRTLCYRYGADLTFTEMIRVESLAKKNKSTWSRLSMHNDTPFVIQLLGAREQYFKRFLNMFEPSKGFKGFNLNLGCPNPKVVRIGQGAALIRRISKTKKIMGVFKEYGYNASIKMRLGLNERDKSHKTYLNLINAVDADFIVVHARYGIQRYADAADFSIYDECVKTGKPIIANGDIRTREQVDYLKSIGVIGVMIGRAAVIEPSIFNKLKGKSFPNSETIKRGYIKLSELYNEPFRYRVNILKRMGRSEFQF